VAGNFSWEFNFADFGFFRLDLDFFRGKTKREFGFQTLFVEITFRGFHAQYLKVTKTVSNMFVFDTLSATNFIEVQQRKKRSNFFAGFLSEGVCFQGI